VKREILVKLPDRAIDDSAQSTLTRILEPDQRLAYGELTQVIFYGKNCVDQRLSWGQLEQDRWNIELQQIETGFH
jgi:hypothetical protein